MYIKGELGLAKISFAPVPPAQCMLFAFKCDSVEKFERFGSSIKILFEAVS